MEAINLDMVTVYAYADSAHARERELWRGFLSYALPVVMSFHVDEFDSILFESVVNSLEDLKPHEEDQMDIFQSIRCISVLLAKEINVTPEFAFAAFYDGQTPSRTYQVKKGRSVSGKAMKPQEEDELIGQWLSSLAHRQDDEAFKNTVNKWKSWFVPK